MHCALQKVGTDSKKVADVVNNYLPRKSEEQNNSRTSLEADCKVSSLARRNSDSRCVILTFLESDGNWRIVALPLQCLSNCNFASGVNIDGLQLVFPPPINALVFDQHKGQRVMPPDCAYAINSFTRSISEANGRRQSQNKTLAYRASKLNGLSGSSSQRLLTCNNILAMNPDGSTAVDSSDMFNDNCKVRKSVKKNSRRKTKRKGRQSQKLSHDTGPTEPEVLSEEYTHWSSNSETCGNNDVDQGVVSYLTRPEIPLTDDSLTKSNFDSNKDDGIFGSVEALKYCTSCVDDVEKSEAIAPAVHNSVGEPTLSNSEDHLRTINPEFSLTAGGVEDIHNNQHFKDMCSKSSSDMQDSLVLDSVSVGSNSDDNTNAGEDVKQSEKISCGIGLSENLLNGVSNAKHTDGTKHGAHSSRSSNKRGKQNKVAPRNASVNRSAVVGNSHGRTGKENNHSVWQKVKRNEFDECGAELKKVSSTFSQIDATSKMAPSLKRNCNFVDINILSRTEDKKHLKSKVGRKMKRRASTGPKQEYNCNSRRGPHSNQAIANQHPGISMKQNEISYIMSHASGQKGDNSALGSHNHNNSVNRLLTTSVECESSESVHSARVYADESKPPRSVCCSVSSENMENEDSSLPKSCGSFDQAMTEEQSPLCVTYLLGDEIDQIQSEAPFIDCKQSHNSGSTLQKWIPIGVKDSGSTISNKPISSSLERCDEITAEDWTLKSSNEGKTVSNFQNLVSSVNSKVTSTGNELQNQRLWNQDASTLKEQRDKYTSPNCCINECTIEDPLLNYSNKIAQAVNDSCRAQLACEAVQMVTGCPIAEFERILHFCSPVICQSPKLQSCLICSRDCTDGVPLCRHETPNISLGCLWEWYEKHGSYGLEIRAEDYENPKRLGVDRFGFRAYFVPSLSAIQLFGTQKSHSLHYSDKSPICVGSGSCETSDTSEKSSNGSRFPIFPMLFPQPRSQDAGILTPPEQMSHPKESLYYKDNVSVQSVDTRHSGDFDLLFEFFESEPPQQRQPLHEKIKELIRGEGPARSTVYGDPTKLNSMNVHDLNPRSWYSVAWYPIYRIPDGKLHAAFLTYHSLGHLVCRSTKIDYPSVDASVVSPVVGLQSYNAQGECWFQLRQSALPEMAELSGLNPSGILKERLRTLEETASLLARAVVNKGNLLSANRHPDYEFFCSRRHL